MTTTDVERDSIAAFLRDSAEATTGGELRQRFGASRVKRAVARGDLVRLLPDIYAPKQHSRAFHVRAKAASLWTDAPVSGLAALFLWGLVADPPEVIEVLVAHGRQPRPQPGYAVRQSTVDLPQSVREGVAVVSPAAAVVLGYGCLPKANRSAMFYSAVRLRLAGIKQLEVVLAAVPRVKARRSLERSIRAASVGVQSYLEERALYKVFNTAEFAGFVRQHEVVIEGNQFFLDMFDRDTKTALELDGRNGHLNEFRQKNITRDCWVATIGIQTLRFSYEDLVNRPEWCRQIVREVLRVRARQFGISPWS
jgi:very-short-patch-repair endonuclease